MKSEMTPNLPKLNLRRSTSNTFAVNSFMTNEKITLGTIPDAIEGGRFVSVEIVS